MPHPSSQRQGTQSLLLETVVVQEGQGNQQDIRLHIPWKVSRHLCNDEDSGNTFLRKHSNSFSYLSVLVFFCELECCARSRVHLVPYL